MSTDFLIKLAGVIIHADCLYPSTERYCRDYLVDETLGENTVSVKIRQADIDRERNISANYDKRHGLETRKWSDEYLETLALYRKIAEKLIKQDIILFHGSAVSVDGNAYLFTAPSGTGKSTHVRLLHELLEPEHEVRYINDDKPLIRFEDSGIYVYGTPWDGKHRKSENICAPLRAVCCIVRSDTNHTERMHGDIWQVLLGQSYCQEEPDGVRRNIALLERLAKEIPFYEVRCNMEPEAAECSWKAINQ